MITPTVYVGIGLFVFFLGLGFVAFYAEVRVKNHRLQAATEKYDGMLQRTLLLQQELTAEREELDYLKKIFQWTIQRPVQATMTDQQVMQLASALTAIVQGNMKANPGGMN